MKKIIGMLCLLVATVAWAQDAAKVAPKSYRVAAENDKVRVLMAFIKPGVTVPMHSHPDYAAVMMVPGQLVFTYPDGHSEPVKADSKRGDVYYKKAESYAIKNMGKTPAAAYIIEFKKPAAHRGKIKLPKPFELIGDTPHGTIFSLIVPPGGRVPMHTHKNDVVQIYFTAGSGEMTDDSGRTEKGSYKSDTMVMHGPLAHSYVNTGKTPMAVVVVELK